MSEETQVVENVDATPSGGGVFDSYLEGVPEEHREVVAGFLQDADTGLKGRLSQAEQLEKQWSPYKDIDLSRFQENPQELNDLLAWQQQVTADDATFEAWLDNAAREAGYTKAEAEELEELEASGEFSRDEIDQLVAERAAEQTAPLEQRLQAIEGEKAIKGIEQEINSAFETLETENKVKFTPEQRSIITDLSQEPEGVESPDWLQKGFARYQQISAAAQREFVEDKTEQPEPAITTGGAPAFKPNNGWAGAEKAARELERQSRQ